MTTEAEQAKQDAIDQVQQNRQEDYVRCATALDRLIRRTGKGGTVTSEDVIAEMGDEYAKIAEPRVIGAVFRNFRAIGRIYANGYRTGTRKERHAAPTMTWRILRVE